MPVIKICPQCRNEEINPEDNFCKICGLNLLEIKAAVMKSYGSRRLEDGTANTTVAGS